MARLHLPLVRMMGRELQGAENPEAVRAVFNKWSRVFLNPRGVDASRIILGGVSGERFSPRNCESSAAVLLLHGGGYVFGSARTHRAMAARLGALAGINGYVIDYRLAPEHPYPAALDDAVLAYRALLKAHGASTIAIAGDSAGGGLTLATLHRLRDEELPLPACIVLFSPWLDLTLSGESHASNADTEIAIREPVPTRCSHWYAGKEDRSAPGISPLFVDHSGLPPTLVQVSSTESLLSDAESFAERARSAGVGVRLEVQEGLWHDWQLSAPLVPESRRAMARAADFIRTHTAAS